MSGGCGGGGGGVSRVPIPNNVRKIIQEIRKTVQSKLTDVFIYTTLKDSDMNPNEAAQRLKMIHHITEIAGKHNAEDVYTMLKECNMDPNEAAQRLLYIDTFHEVKKKRDRQRHIGSDTSEAHRRTRGSQWQGVKGVRGTSFSSKVSDDVGDGSTLSLGKECGDPKSSVRSSRPTRLVDSGTENNVVHVASSSADNVHSTLIMSNGSYNHKLAPQLSKDVSSSTSVVNPSQNCRYTCTVGAIKCEIVKNSGSSESHTSPTAGIKSCVGPLIADSVQVTAENVDYDNTTGQPNSGVVETNHLSESSQLPSLLTQNSSQAVESKRDSQLSQPSNEPLNVDAFDNMTAAIADSRSFSPRESEFKGSAPKLDLMLEKLTLTPHQPVVFPAHLQVPEAFKSQFTFGSLDATLDDCNSISATEATQQNNKSVTEPSLSNLNVVATTQEGDSQDQPLSSLVENVLLSKDNISSDPAPKPEQKKLEMMPPLGGFQNPLLQTTRDYNFGLMPHLLSPPFVQLDAPAPQSGSAVVSSTMGSNTATQPATAGQGSIALSPPLFPYFRQLYPNYFPYNPYFPHMYLPQNAHLLNHGIFPQPPPTGNVYAQQAAAAAVAAAAGVKLPVPSQYKQGSSAGSLIHLGVPSGYGSHAASVGCGAAVTLGSSASEDLTASQIKDDNLYSPVQQGEDPQAWASAAGQDVPNLHPNYFYNFPQGHHHMAFSPLQAALYHSSQTPAPQSTVQPLLHKPQSTSGTVEAVAPPCTSDQQPQYATQVNWNTTLLNRETS